jgi:hypothetical protein
MKRTCPIILAALLAGSALEAQAVGRMADVSVVDRASGTTLETHYYRGEYWVAGAPGARYSISIRNRLGERLLAVTAVDGVNVISGDTASWGQTGYVFGAGQAYEITGWRKTNAQVAAFEFVSSPSSYAERTGRPANVGVIGVALFRERVPEPVMAPMDSIASAPSPAAERNAAAKQGASGGASVAELARQESKLGTGHGPRETSYVEHTEFARLQSQPNEIIRIRYDSRENLLAMGVIPRHLPLQPEPFPESPAARYVPDPPGGGGLR